MLIGCNNDTITTSKKEINQDKLDYVKEIYLECLKNNDCNKAFFIERKIIHLYH